MNAKSNYFQKLDEIQSKYSNLKNEAIDKRPTILSRIGLEVINSNRVLTNFNKKNRIGNSIKLVNGSNSSHYENKNILNSFNRSNSYNNENRSANDNDNIDGNNSYIDNKNKINNNNHNKNVDETGESGNGNIINGKNLSNVLLEKFNKQVLLEKSRNYNSSLNLNNNNNLNLTSDCEMDIIVNAAVYASSSNNGKNINSN